MWNLETEGSRYIHTHMHTCNTIFKYSKDEMLRCEQHLELRRRTVKVNHQIAEFGIGCNKAEKCGLGLFFPFH